MALKSPLINVMERAARKAGRGLIRDFGEVEQLQVSTKGPGDFVSAADHKAERTIREELKRVRPDFGFLMEESGASGDQDAMYRWVVDPLDGTTNFLHGIPQFCVSIGVEGRSVIRGKATSEFVAGVIYDPIRDETYWAEKGVGAYLNDRRLRVSGRRDLGQALIGASLPMIGRGDPDRYVREVRAVMDRCAGLRCLGSAALAFAWVASGRYDAYWEMAISPWDMAAGIVLVREAGGQVTEPAGGDAMVTSGAVLASNGHLHEDMRGILKKAA